VGYAADVLVWLPVSCPGGGPTRRKIFVPGLRCTPCRVSHALLPAFTLAWQLDVAETADAVVGQVTGGACGCARRCLGWGSVYDRARVCAAVPGAHASPLAPYTSSEPFRPSCRR
jgi:hypothetical protein